MGSFIWLKAVLMAAMLATGVAQAIEVTPEVGGSNFVVYDVGQYPKSPTEDNWRKIKFVIPHFHENKPKVLKALKDLHQSGQRKISLMIWYIPSYQLALSNPSLTPCLTQAHVICPSNGRMPPEIFANLAEILHAIDQLNFETVVIRFGGQWYSDPFSWPEGPKGEEFFKTFLEDSWKFISSTHDQVDALKLKSKRIYDLGGELMGHPYSMRPWVSQYLVEMLKRYKAKYGTSDSVGFSFNFGSWMGSTQREAARASLRMMSSVGFNPAYLALDVYEKANQSLPEFFNLLAQENWAWNYPVYIQETFYNNERQAQTLLRSKGRMNLRFILQWPTEPNGGHFQTDIPLKFDAYLPTKGCCG